MSLNKFRRMAFLASRTAGDVNAVKRGKIGQRVANRIMGRAASKAMRGAWFK